MKYSAAIKTAMVSAMIDTALSQWEGRVFRLDAEWNPKQRRIELIADLEGDDYLLAYVGPFENEVHVQIVERGGTSFHISRVFDTRVSMGHTFHYVEGEAGERIDAYFNRIQADAKVLAAAVRTAEAAG